MSTQPSPTRRMVEHLWTADGVPEPDAEACRRLLLDHVAVAAWGSRLEAGRIMREHAIDDLGGTGPMLPVIGTGLRAPAIPAAMANSVAASAYEFDDTHAGGSVHPGAVIHPAALAAAQLADCDTATFVRAVVVGYEVMCRVGRAAGGPAHRARHFHPTATAGHFGAAAAASVCFGLDVEETMAALTIAGSMAGGSMQFLIERAWTKQIHGAFAIQRGVDAARLAARGWPGVQDPIAGERAFLAAQSTDPRPETLTEGLGTVPSEIALTGIKPYPSCRSTQSPLDALFAAVGGRRITAADVDRIVFGLIGPAIGTVFDPVERTRRPTTLVEAQFSLPFVAAVALLDGEVTPHQFEPDRYLDPAVTALTEKVECVHDPALDPEYPRQWPAWVRLELSDGEAVESRVSVPKGDPGNPLGWDDLKAKFESLTRTTHSLQQRSRIVAAIEEMPAEGALERLLEAL